jgi:hypothetical protein
MAAALMGASILASANARANDPKSSNVTALTVRPHLPVASGARPPPTPLRPASRNALMVTPSGHHVRPSRRHPHSTVTFGEVFGRAGSILGLFTGLSFAYAGWWGHQDAVEGVQSIAGNHWEAFATGGSLVAAWSAYRLGLGFRRDHARAVAAERDEE